MLRRRRDTRRRRRGCVRASSLPTAPRCRTGSWARCYTSISRIARRASQSKPKTLVFKPPRDSSYSVARSMRRRAAVRSTLKRLPLGANRDPRQKVGVPSVEPVNRIAPKGIAPNADYRIRDSSLARHHNSIAGDPKLHATHLLVPICIQVRLADDTCARADDLYAEDLRRSSTTPEYAHRKVMAVPLDVSE